MMHHCSHCSHSKGRICKGDGGCKLRGWMLADRSLSSLVHVHVLSKGSDGGRSSDTSVWSVLPLPLCSAQLIYTSTPSLPCFIPLDLSAHSLNSARVEAHQPRLSSYPPTKSRTCIKHHSLSHCEHRSLHRPLSPHPPASCRIYEAASMPRARRHLLAHVPHAPCFPEQIASVRGDAAGMP